MLSMPLAVPAQVQQYKTYTMEFDSRHVVFEGIQVLEVEEVMFKLLWLEVVGSSYKLEVDYRLLITPVAKCQ